MIWINEINGMNDVKKKNRIPNRTTPIFVIWRIIRLWFCIQHYQISRRFRGVWNTSKSIDVTQSTTIDFDCSSKFSCFRNTLQTSIRTVRKNQTNFPRIHSRFARLFYYYFLHLFPLFNCSRSMRAQWLRE